MKQTKIMLPKRKRLARICNESQEPTRAANDVGDADRTVQIFMRNLGVVITLDNV